MMTLKILASARKHGVDDADIVHAVENAMRFVEQEYDGELRMFMIGPDRAGRLLEIVMIPVGTPSTVIHADLLAPTRYRYL